MKFPSKKDWWMGIIVWALVGVLLWICYQSIRFEFDFFGMIISLFVSCLLIWIWFDTNYRIEKNQLKISYGPIKKNVNIHDIQSIRYTTNPFVAPALSMHRIEINYGKFETLQVSPKERQSFVNELLKQNPQIQIKSLS